MMDKAGEKSPHLDEAQQQQAADNTLLTPLVIHEIIREQGQKHLDRPLGGLAWSGLAAGLSIGFSFIVQAYLKAGLPDARWSVLVHAFGYSLGFLIVVLGQQELFTETTLTAMIPALTARKLATLIGTLRVWGIVLATNLIGTLLFGVLAARLDLFPPDVRVAMTQLSALTMAYPFGHTLATAALSGWLIALMVWLLPGAGPARPLIIVALTYVVALCQFPHVIAGSVEASFGVASGAASVRDYLFGFLVPTLIGNIIGGTALVALLNHAQIAGELDHSGEPDATS